MKLASKEVTISPETFGPVMNKRIEHLKSLAMVEVQSHGAFGEPESYFSLDPDKFAELIIKECASICENNGKSYKHSFTPAKAKLAETTSAYCGDLIKQHFGVE